LLKLFGEQPTTDAPDTGQPPVDEPSTSSSISDLVGLARDYYDRAEERLREGDWAGYGANIDKLEEIINQLEEAALD
jgi:uncharacterized membrane protein (UPF0182 family)